MYLQALHSKFPFLQIKLIFSQIKKERKRNRKSRKTKKNKKKNNIFFCVQHL